MLEDLWAFKVQVIPVALALFLFEAPAMIRRAKRLYYVPIYFTFFPLRELNSDLSIYLGEDYFVGTGQLGDQDAEVLRGKILAKSIVSMVIAAILTPLFTGFVGAFFLTTDTLFQFLLVLVAFKLVGIWRAIAGFRHHAIATTRNKVLLGVIYFFYLGVIVQMVLTAYTWTFPYVQAGTWHALLADLSKLLFGKVVAQGLVLALLTAVFVWLITEHKFRRRDSREP